MDEVQGFPASRITSVGKGIGVKNEKGGGAENEGLGSGETEMPFSKQTTERKAYGGGKTTTRIN